MRKRVLISSLAILGAMIFVPRAAFGQSLPSFNSAEEKSAWVRTHQEEYRKIISAQQANAPAEQLAGHTDDATVPSLKSSNVSGATTAASYKGTLRTSQSAGGAPVRVDTGNPEKDDADYRAAKVAYVKRLEDERIAQETARKETWLKEQEALKAASQKKADDQVKENPGTVVEETPAIERSFQLPTNLPSDFPKVSLTGNAEVDEKAYAKAKEEYYAKKAPVTPVKEIPVPDVRIEEKADVQEITPVIVSPPSVITQDDYINASPEKKAYIDTHAVEFNIIKN